MNSKRSIALVVSLLVAICAIAVTSCSSLGNKEQVIQDLIDLDSVDTITIQSGSNGEFMTLEDEQQIQEAKESLAKLKLTKVDVEDSTGWTYVIELKSKSLDRKLIFQGDNQCHLPNGSDYEVKGMDQELRDIIDSCLHKLEK